MRTMDCCLPKIQELMPREVFSLPVLKSEHPVSFTESVMTLSVPVTILKVTLPLPSALLSN